MKSSLLFRRFCVGFACLSVCAFTNADEASSLRAELETLKSEYSTRIQALEERLNQVETQTAAAAAVPTPPPVTAEPQVSSSRSSMSAFNPAMSVILSGIYADTSQDPASFGFAGFMPNGGEIGPGERGFSLGESELTFTANVDPYFSANLTTAISGEDEIGVEEAFFRTIALPLGFTVKGGRFFSGLGYVNEVHAHAWDFVDQPLAYQAFLGGQLGQDGLQLKWVAPTDMFVEAGMETGNGRSFPGTRLNRNAPNGSVTFVHVGNDIGNSASWRAGVSFLRQRAQDRSYESTDDLGMPVVNAFSGRTRLWVGDFVWKWAPMGNPVQRYWKVQGEYLRRTESGSLAFDIENSSLSDGYRATQYGWYLQSVYQFRPRWRAGVRYDALNSGNPSIGLIDSGLLSPAAFPELLSESPRRTTFMLDWSPSEFSRIRTQYAWDDSRAADRDRQIFLQYLYSLGAHGAHKY